MAPIDPPQAGAYTVDETAVVPWGGPLALSVGIFGRPKMLLPAYIIDAMLRRERELRRREELRIETLDPAFYPLEEAHSDPESRGDIEVDFGIDY